MKVSDRTRCHSPIQSIKQGDGQGDKLTEAVSACCQSTTAGDAGV